MHVDVLFPTLPQEPCLLAPAQLPKVTPTAANRVITQDRAWRWHRDYLALQQEKLEYPKINGIINGNPLTQPQTRCQILTGTRSGFTKASPHVQLSIYLYLSLFISLYP